MPEIDKVAFMKAIDALMSDGEEDLSNEFMQFYHSTLSKEIEEGILIDAVDVPPGIHIKLWESIENHIKKREQLKLTLSHFF